MADANIKAVITAEDRASATLSRFGNKASGMSNVLRRSLKLAAVGVAAAGAAVVAFGVSSVKSYQESEEALTQLNAVLKSTKGVAGVTAKEATNLANSLQKVTKYSDEETLGAENLLLTFTKISKDIFPQATETVLDMSTALGQDLKSSSIQLGKALQDPILGVTALRRVGVNFNDAQKEVIKNLVETGRSAEAQKMILKELQTEFGGSARAAGETFAGKLAILKNQFDEIKESIGKTIVEAITPFVKQLADFVASDQFQAWLTNLTNWLQVNLPIAIDYVVNTLIPSLINIFDAVWPVLKTVLNWLGKFIKFLGDHEQAVWVFIGVLGAMKAAFIISGVIAKFKAALAAARAAYKLTSAVLSVPITIAIAVAAALAAMYLVRREAQKTMDVLDELGRAESRNNSMIDDFRWQSQNAKSAKERRAASRGLYAMTNGAEGSKNAKGTDFFTGGMALVGERGPELVSLPRGSKVYRNDETNKMLGGSTTINITVPMWTGSANERRRVARLLIKDIQDIAGINGKSVSDMMSSKYGLVT